MFCPQCKSLLRPEEDIMKCTRCGYVKDPDVKKARTKIQELEEDLKDVPVFKDLDTMPIDMAVTCPECENVGAFWHLRQTRSADEATTRFYRCTKCKHTWREYS